MAKNATQKAPNGAISNVKFQTFSPPQSEGNTPPHTPLRQRTFGASDVCSIGILQYFGPCGQYLAKCHAILRISFRIKIKNIYTANVGFVKRQIGLDDRAAVFTWLLFQAKKLLNCCMAHNVSRQRRMRNITLMQSVNALMQCGTCNLIWRKTALAISP